MPITQGASLGNVFSGHSTNWVKLNRKTAFSWYSCEGTCADSTRLPIKKARKVTAFNLNKYVAKNFTGCYDNILHAKITFPSIFRSISRAKGEKGRNSEGCPSGKPVLQYGAI